MVHIFRMHGDCFAYDVESGSLYEIDDVTAEIVNEIKGEPTDFSHFSKKEVREAFVEVSVLREKGNLFSSPLDISFPTYSKDIKALCLHICHDCNLKCKYCFADEGKYLGEAEYMSEDVGYLAVDFLLQNSGSRRNLEIDFFGGEPLMNFAVVKSIVAYAKEKAKGLNKEFKFTLTTNAILLTDDIIEFLNAEMDNVVLSIDGRKHIHDEVRKTVNGKGSFDIALKNSLKFKATRGKKSYYIRGTFTALNTDFHEDILYLNDVGFDQISIEPVVLPESHSLTLKKEHIDIVNNNYEKLAKEYVLRRKKEDKWFNFFHFYLDMENSPCLTKRLKGCGAGNEYMAISPKGDIYPCHQFVGKEEYKMGNVYKATIDESIKEKFANSNLLTKPLCENCFAKYHCSGGCAANNIAFAGDINEPHTKSCEFMKKRFECSLYVYAKEHL